jgi:haloalkane dehalogenase
MLNVLKSNLVFSALFFTIQIINAQTNLNLLPTKTILVDNINISYSDKGKGHTLLFIHGIPTNGAIWRNIIDTVSLNYRTIAIDLPGYGKSDMPKDFSIETNYHYLKSFIDSLHLENITIVVHDLGSLYGIKYAVENPDNVKNIILLESVFMPTNEWYKQLPLSAKLMFRLLNKEWISKRLIYNKNTIAPLMLKMGTLKKLSITERNIYLQDFNTSKNRRLILLKGPSPATMPKKGISKQSGDFADEFDKNAIGLKSLSENKSILILYAKPGMVTKKKAIKYAENNFKNLSLYQLGKGKHFLQEDFPQEISIQLLKWLQDNP